MQTLDLNTPARGLVAAQIEVNVLDPLTTESWNDEVQNLEGSTFFHTREWARVLVETYGHKPVYLAGLHRERMTCLLPLMAVCSRFTGRRGVSLPFTDFCGTLGSPADAAKLWQAALVEGKREGWRYLETRNGIAGSNGADSKKRQSIVVFRHVIPLTTEPAMLSGLASSAKRALAKARASAVSIEFRSDDSSLASFYRLHCETRRRHGVPPQPFRFFDNILRFVLKRGLGFIALARIEGKEAAAGVFFTHKRQAIFKFGASDGRFQSCRPNNMVMWEAMRRLQSQGYDSLDLGRTSVMNGGLRRFKLTLGASEEDVSYYRYDFSSEEFVTAHDEPQGWFNCLFRLMPLPLLRLSGKILYPHLS
jgi:hypothetical protein